MSVEGVIRHANDMLPTISLISMSEISEIFSDLIESRKIKGIFGLIRLFYRTGLPKDRAHSLSLALP